MHLFSIQHKYMITTVGLMCDLELLQSAPKVLQRGGLCSFAPNSSNCSGALRSPWEPTVSFHDIHNPLSLCQSANAHCTIAL